MIYVFDVNAVKEEELEMFAKTSELLEKFSPDAKLFVLIHKMDTIKPQRKEETLKERKDTISKAIQGSLEVSEFFGTSIWDVTLYNVNYHLKLGLEQDHSNIDP
jgi:Ras-related GTP-binding protein A/B